MLSQILLIVFASFFAINLAVAVIFTSFAEDHDETSLVEAALENMEDEEAEAEAKAHELAAVAEADEDEEEEGSFDSGTGSSRGRVSGYDTDGSEPASEHAADEEAPAARPSAVGQAVSLDVAGLPGQIVDAGGDKLGSLTPGQKILTVRRESDGTADRLAPIVHTLHAYLSSLPEPQPALPTSPRSAELSGGDLRPPGSRILGVCDSANDPSRADGELDGADGAPQENGGSEKSQSAPVSPFQVDPAQLSGRWAADVGMPAVGAVGAGGEGVCGGEASRSATPGRKEPLQPRKAEVSSSKLRTSVLGFPESRLEGRDSKTVAVSLSGVRNGPLTSTKSMRHSVLASSKSKRHLVRSSMTMPQLWRHRLRHAALHGLHLARAKAFGIVHSATMEELTMLLIIANTVIMASDKYRLEESVSQSFEDCNYAFTAYFAVEMLLKMFGEGLGPYFRNKLNLFDFFVVTFSFVDIGVAQAGGSAGGNLSVLRSFRIMRIFKLARAWKDLNNMITIIGKSVISLSYLSILLGLDMFVFALLGQQLFSHNLFFCDLTGVPAAQPLCPPGVAIMDCPDVPQCYVPCSAMQAGSWVTYSNPVYGGNSDTLQINGYPYFDGSRYALGGLCLPYKEGVAPMQFNSDAMWALERNSTGASRPLASAGPPVRWGQRSLCFAETDAAQV